MKKFGGHKYLSIYFAPLTRLVRFGAIAQLGERNTGRALARSKMKRTHGAIAQLGERYRGTVEVGGSIPPSSTKSFDKYPDAGVAGVLPDSIENLEFLTHSGS